MPIADIILKTRVNSDRMYSLTRKAASSAAAGANGVGDSFMAAASGGSSYGGGMSDGSSGTGNAKSQLGHFWGHQYTAITAIATRCSGQELYVAQNKPTRSAGRSTSPGGAKRLVTKAASVDSLEPLENHALLDLIDDPNPIMVRWSLLFTTIVCLKLTGKAYWWITEAGGGKYNLWPIPPHWIKPADNLRRTWLVQPFGQTEELRIPGEQIVFFNLPDPANPFGSVSPLQAQALAISADEQIQKSQYASFQRGIRPSVIVAAGKQPLPAGQTGEAMRPILTPAQKRQIINAIKSQYSGVEKNGDPIILDGLIESVTKFSLSPSEMDYLNSSKMTRDRIFQMFGVNPIIVGEVEGANRAGAWVAEKSFCDNVCNPLLALMGQVLTAWVGPLFGEGLKVWFEPCTAADAELEARDWNTAMGKGAVTLNEFRVHRLGLPPFDDPAADELPGASAALPAISGTGTQAAAQIKQARLVNPYTMKPLGLPGPGLK